MQRVHSSTVRLALDRGAPGGRVFPCVLVGVMSLFACGGESTAPPTSVEAASPSVSERIDTVGDQLGCERFAESENPYWGSRWGFDESVDCLIDGRDQARVHTFNPTAREQVLEVFERMSSGAGPFEGNPCPDGRRAWAYMLLVVGPDWAVATPHPGIAETAVEDLDGELILDGSEGPPASYPLVDPCAPDATRT